MPPNAMIAQTTADAGLLCGTPSSAAAMGWGGQERAHPHGCSGSISPVAWLQMGVAMPRSMTCSHSPRPIQHQVARLDVHVRVPAGLVHVRQRGCQLHAVAPLRCEGDGCAPAQRQRSSIGQVAMRGTVQAAQNGPRE